MGYDMHWQVVPAEVAAEAAKNQAAFDALVTARDSMLAGVGTWPSEKDDPVTTIVRDTIKASPEYQAAVAAVQEAWPADAAYFRLNIWGMQMMRQIMAELGIGYWSEENTNWPDPIDYGFTWEDELDMNDPRLVRHQAAVDDIRRRSGGGVGIPLHKFSSNDGWIVTPEEIREGLYAYDGLDQTTIDAALTKHCDMKEAGLGDWRKWFDDWMEWNRRAMSEGEGYAVR